MSNFFLIYKLIAFKILLMVHIGVIKNYKNGKLNLIESDDPRLKEFRIAVSNASIDKIRELARTSITFISNRIGQRNSDYNLFLSEMNSYVNSVLNGMGKRKELSVYLLFTKNASKEEKNIFLKASFKAIHEYLEALFSEAKFTDGMLYELSLIFYGNKNEIEQDYQRLEDEMLKSIAHVTNLLKTEKDVKNRKQRAQNTEKIRLIVEAHKKQLKKEEKKAQRKITKKDLNVRKYRRVHVKNVHPIMKIFQKKLECLDKSSLVNYYIDLYADYKNDLIEKDDEYVKIFKGIEKAYENYKEAIISKSAFSMEAAKLTTYSKVKGETEKKLAKAIFPLLFYIKTEKVEWPLIQKIFDLSDNDERKACEIYEKENARIQKAIEIAPCRPVL